MNPERNVGLQVGVREGVLLLMLLAGSFGAVLALTSVTGWGSAPVVEVGENAAWAISLTSGVFAGVFLVLGALVAYLNWRLDPDPRTGWLVAASILISSQALLLAALEAYRYSAGASTTGWPLHVVAGTSAIGVLLVGLGSRQSTGRTVDPLAVGLSLGLLAAGCLALPEWITTTTVPTSVLTSLIMAAHLAGALLIVRNDALPRPAALLMVATLLAIGAGHAIAPAGLSGTMWDALVSLGLASAGAAWLMTAYASQRAAAKHEHERADELEGSLMATVGSDREHRERLHELRSTIAGLVHAAGMLQRQDVNSAARHRLQETMARELTRMQRLLSEEKAAPAVIDLDDALNVIFDLHRLKGRQIEFHRSGDAVQARYDALAEVVNILLDNAATHGGSDNSVVKVSRRDEDTVEIAVTDFGRGVPAHDVQRIFAWGERGADSPGQGIGLHVAQRLITEDGGSLRCAQPVGGGSSFVISLPAARRSVEDDHVIARPYSS